MLTNTYCTIIRTDTDGNYNTVLYTRCMWQGKEAYRNGKNRYVRKYGEENTGAALIYIPDVNADVQKGDYIINSESDIPPDMTAEKPLTVMSVTRCNYGNAKNQYIKVVAE